VTLSWEQPPAPFVVHHYVIERNGKLLAGDVIGTKFVDGEAEPGSKYHYSIVGVDAAGARTDPGVVAIETHSPPLEDARMDGRYVVKFHITEQGNLQSGASGFPELFTFKPRCGSGSCDVSLSIKKVSGSTVLSRSGTSYSGTLHAPFLIRSCHGGTVAETLVFHIHPLAAGPSHGEWRVTKFEGTMDETSSSSGCMTGHLAYALSGITQG